MHDDVSQEQPGFKEVNLRHATAVALVGWYLMLAPFNAENRSDDSAPLSKWRTGSAFDSAQACERNRAMTLSTIAHVSARGASDKQGKDALFHDFVVARCIASDDPRLKEK